MSSPFALLVDSYRPPAEFNVVLPRGEVFVFRGLSSSTEFDEINTGATETISAVRRACPPDLKKFLVESDQVWRDAIYLEKTILGWHAESTREDPKKPLQPVGDRLPKPDRNDFLEMAMGNAPVFKDIVMDWRIAQWRVHQEEGLAEIEALKND